MSFIEKAGNAFGTAIGIVGDINRTRRSPDQTFVNNNQSTQDWRVRLALAPGSSYLYNDPALKTDLDSQHILWPLRNTDGVIFPYTPKITISYAANYDTTELTHSNYKIYQYKNSSVDQITISCDFTAQDTYEANYMLATIHFFKSVTKMFYGQDDDPKPGTPPPLCYLYGLGEYQFDQHPLVISSFSYNLPDNVDYIRADSNLGASHGRWEQIPDENETKSNSWLKAANTIRNISNALNSVRLGQSILPGGVAPAPLFTPISPPERTATYVPTKIQLQISAYPVVSRNDINNNFSFKDYASGKLLKGSTNANGGGMW